MPKPVDLEAIKYYLGTNFLGFNLTVLKEAALFLEHVPENFSVSGALAIFHMELYSGDVKPSSGFKAKAMDFFRKMTQKQYRELIWPKVRG